LIKIRAHRGFDRAGEMPQDAILVETLDRLQGGFDRRGDRCLLRRAFFRCDPEMRVETGMKKLHDIRRHARVLAQRRPHVILRVRHANLPEKARMGAQ
jgi:hypothetical protein